MVEELPAYGGFLKYGVPPVIIHFNGIFSLKPTIFGVLPCMETPILFETLQLYELGSSPIPVVRTAEPRFFWVQTWSEWKPPTETYIYHLQINGRTKNTYNMSCTVHSSSLGPNKAIEFIISQQWQWNNVQLIYRSPFSKILSDPSTCLVNQNTANWDWV